MGPDPAGRGWHDVRRTDRGLEGHPVGPVKRFCVQTGGCRGHGGDTSSTPDTRGTRDPGKGHTTTNPPLLGTPYTKVRRDNSG